ncbi:hypothetical protein M5K25_012554 [Dendrobium thyrsiflorum]|uniref:Uncharacterized protein n=1 Tax=Dendrobium thyrsiflorum TaxID=117978 RepID=A0ABD0UXT2_DENTH
MGRSEREGSCKRHPTHKDSDGVCPYCLRDRLTNFSRSSSSSTNNAASSTVSSTAYYSSSYSEASSLDSSPPHEELNAKNILELFQKGRMDMLRKSKSIAFYKEGETRKDQEKKSGKRKGFWAKFMMGGGGRRKHREGGFSHSKTMKEKPSSKWNFFSEKSKAFVGSSVVAVGRKLRSAQSAVASCRDFASSVLARRPAATPPPSFAGSALRISADTDSSSAASAPPPVLPFAGSVRTSQPRQSAPTVRRFVSVSRTATQVTGMRLLVCHD